MFFSFKSVSASYSISTPGFVLFSVALLLFSCNHLHIITTYTNMICKTAIGLTASMALLARSVLAANATTISATGCVDILGMSNCLNSAVS